MGWPLRKYKEFNPCFFTQLYMTFFNRLCICSAVQYLSGGYVSAVVGYDNDYCQCFCITIAHDWFIHDCLHYASAITVIFKKTYLLADELCYFIFMYFLDEFSFLPAAAPVLNFLPNLFTQFIIKEHHYEEKLCLTGITNW